MKLQHQQIAIVGGGPGGLTLARLLQLKGANVKVYERDFNRNARLTGSPLDLHEQSGLAALQKAGLLEAFKKAFRPGADKTIITNERAEIFFSDHETKQEENFGQEHFRPEIDRGPLRDLLLESLQPDTVLWDCHFTSMENQGAGWLLHFKNGASVYADLVIAADGARSKIRPYLTNIRAQYSGITMLEINVPAAEGATPYLYRLLQGGKVMAFGNEKCLLGGQKGNGDLGFYASFKTAETWVADNGLDYADKAQLLSWFKETYSEWSSVWEALFENAALPVVPRPVYYAPLEQNWEARSNLTLIGDAAHVMPPFAGEGANMAMLDALELSEYLTSNSNNTLQEAISDYEVDMRKRAAVAAQESLENGVRMHSKEALDHILHMFSGGAFSKND
jgi:2-polyprenyl-6-methoxyphenol hydroxylase-like FAD-dependent oxidoreductase